MKTARTVPASSTRLTGMISTALIASASSVNRTLNVSFYLLLHIFCFFSLCACLFSYFLRNVEVGVNPMARELDISILLLSVFQ